MAKNRNRNSRSAKTKRKVDRLKRALGLGDISSVEIVRHLELGKSLPKDSVRLNKYLTMRIFKAPFDEWRIAVRPDEIEGDVRFSHPVVIRILPNLPKPPKVQKNKRGFLISPKDAEKVA